MYRAYHKEYSVNLNREMEFSVIGHAGRPFLVFPAQSGRFFDFDNFLMVDAIKDKIEAGQIQLFCIDSLDDDTFCAEGEAYVRMDYFERYFRYVTEEIYPRIIEIHHQTSNSKYHTQVVATGCSMGALHAINFFLRKPQMFSGVFALSGLYDLSMFFKGETNELIYKNSSLDNLANIPWHHEYVQLYKEKQILVTVGQGKWEEESIRDTRRLQDTFKALDINNAVFEYWGHDVDHDWPWWRVQFAQYINIFI